MDKTSNDNRDREVYDVSYFVYELFMTNLLNCLSTHLFTGHHISYKHFILCLSSISELSQCQRLSSRGATGVK